MEPACMLVVSDAKIADLLLNKPEGVRVEALAEQSGLDAGKLGRILRLLATKHCFKEGISQFRIRVSITVSLH